MQHLVAHVCNAAGRGVTVADDERLHRQLVAGAVQHLHKGADHQDADGREMHIGGVLHHQQQITCHRKTVGRIPPDSLGQVCHQLLHLGAVLRQGIIEHIAEIHPPRQHQDKAVGEANAVQLMDALRDTQHSLFDALDALICDLVLEQDIVVVLLQPVHHAGAESGTFQTAL